MSGHWIEWGEMRVCLPCCSMKSNEATLQQRGFLLSLFACVHGELWPLRLKTVVFHLPERAASEESETFFFVDASLWRTEVCGRSEPVSKPAHGHLLPFAPPVSAPGWCCSFCLYSELFCSFFFFFFSCVVWLDLLVNPSFQTIGTPCFKIHPSDSFWPLGCLEWELLGAPSQTRPMWSITLWGGCWLLDGN